MDLKRGLVLGSLGIIIIFLAYLVFNVVSENQMLKDVENAPATGVVATSTELADSAVKTPDNQITCDSFKCLEDAFTLCSGNQLVKAVFNAPVTDMPGFTVKYEASFEIIAPTAEAGCKVKQLTFDGATFIPDEGRAALLADFNSSEFATLKRYNNLLNSVAGVSYLCSGSGIDLANYFQTSVTNLSDIPKLDCSLTDDGKASNCVYDNKVTCLAGPAYGAVIIDITNTSDVINKYNPGDSISNSAVNIGTCNSFDCLYSMAAACEKDASATINYSAGNPFLVGVMHNNKTEFIFKGLDVNGLCQMDQKFISSLASIDEASKQKLLSQDTSGEKGIVIPQITEEDINSTIQDINDASAMSAGTITSCTGSSDALVTYLKNMSTDSLEQNCEFSTNTGSSCTYNNGVVCNTPVKVILNKN